MRTIFFLLTAILGSTAPSLACSTPGTLSLVTRTASSITVSVTPGNPFHQLEYGPLGFTPGSGTKTPWFTGLTHAVTGLSGSTGYDFYIRDSCANGQKSAWTSYFGYSTTCATPATIPWFENFDQSSFVGRTTINGLGQYMCGWLANPNQGYAWVTGPPFQTLSFSGPASDHSGRSKYMLTDRFGGISGGNSSAFLRTPQINLTGATQPAISFWYHMWGSQIDSLIVEASEVGTNTWVRLGSIPANTTQFSSQTSPWQQQTYPLTTFAGQTVNLRFIGKGTTTFPTLGRIAIDDIYIGQATGCIAPSNFVNTGVQTNSASFSLVLGSSSHHQISFGPPGTAAGAGTIHRFSGLTTTIPGLITNTTYEAWVRDSCAPGNFSSWVGPISLTTNNCPNGCNYILKLVDSFGDGWAANSAGTQHHALEVIVNGVATSYSLLGANDTAAIFSISLCDNDSVQLRFVNRGQWSNECGWQFRDASGTLIHSEATGGPNLTTGVKFTLIASCSSPCQPSITVNPTNTLAYTSPGTAYFLCKSNDTTAIFQWQENTGSSWVDITSSSNTFGINSDSLYISGISISNNNFQYRCIVSTCRIDTSSIAVLTVLCSDTTLTSSGDMLAFNNSSSAHFTVASNDTLSNFQWQSNVGSGWNDIQNSSTYLGVTSDSLVIISPNILMNGDQFRCIVSGCQQDTSDVATLFVRCADTTMVMPQNFTAYTNPGWANFTSKHSDTTATYQWQQSNGAGWIDLSNLGNYSGATSDSLVITGVTTAMNNYGYRCIVTGCSTDTSDVAVLTVSNGIGLGEAALEKLTISPNPTNGLISLSSEFSGTYELLSLDGRLVESGEIKKEYDLSQQPNGVYNLRLQTAEGTRVLKIVKQ